MEYRAAIPIIDASGRLIGVLAGFPGSVLEWLKVHQEASRALEDARHQSKDSGGDNNHRRGKFQTLLCGVLHGGGQQKPGNLDNNDVNRQLVEELNSLEPFKRLAGFATCRRPSLLTTSLANLTIAAMTTWAPKLYAYYVEHLGTLHAHHPELRRIFTSSIFAASTYNLGPRTVCYPHKDFANLPFGWCSATALGSFNPKTSGHLVLWECGLVIEFPPGSTILLPSPIVSHSNAAISKNESRRSFTQYTAGGIFRWVDNNFQMTVDYRASLSPSELEDLADRNSNRYSLGLSLLPQLKLCTTSST